MNTRMLHGFCIAAGALCTAPAALAAGPYAVPAPAGATATRPLLHEIPDPELASLRGRFIVGNNTVAYFGVSMLSTWASPTGQQLQGGVTLGMQFAPQAQLPQITFTPTMTIVQGTAAPAAAGDVSRSVDASGLANVNGLVQGIQIAGDGNRVVNTTNVKVTTGGTGPASNGITVGNQPIQSQLASGDAGITIAFDPGRGVSLDLSVAGQGLVSQWIRAGSAGQSVQLTADAQSISNLLQLNLVLNPANAGSQALNDAAQALLQARASGTASGSWH